MNNDIRPPRRPQQLQRSESRQVPYNPVERPAVPDPVVSPPVVPITEDSNMQLPERAQKPSRKKKILGPILAFLGVILLAGLGAVIWYNFSLTSVDAKSTVHSRVVIESGTSPTVIGEQLHSKKLIRSSQAFDIYTRLSGTRSKLQAGSYSFSQADSTQQIVAKLAKGDVTDGDINITFFPGAMLVDNSDQADNKKVDVRSVLRRAGYADNEITAAFNKQYDHPLFASKPAGMDIEGYVYGDTYNFRPDATVEEILTRTFDEFYAVVEKENLIEGFKKQGLSLYQGITLASIIQREVSGLADQKQVAQVFYTRLADGMPLGSDVTYHYAADKLGIARDYRLVSPYNTRSVVGLPPGPIAVPGLTALQAAAAPAPGDYVYFLSGDDDKTYYARTNAEHEANIQNHCKEKCLLP